MEASTFAEIVRSVFNCWPAFEYIRSFGTGGAETEAKLEWMIDVVSERLARRPVVPEAAVIEEFISEIVDNEFDTIIEDGTLRSVSELLCSTREMWNRGDVAGARRLLNDLEFKRKSRPVGIDQVREDVLSCSDDTDDEVAPRSSSNNDSMDTTSYPVNETQPEEDGWTIVRSRRSMKR